MKLHTSLIAVTTAALVGAIGIGALLAYQLMPPVRAPIAVVQQHPLCTLSTDAISTVYDRPSTSASVFGTIDPSESVVLGGRTADGWLGFDPGVAQAPNVGPFRLRWIAPSTAVTLSGSCAALPTVASVPPHTCFIMAQTDILIRQTAQGTSPAIARMHFGDYIEATGRTGKGPDVWIRVSSPAGTLPAGTSGWISLTDVNFNGDCDRLPRIQ